MGQRCTGGFQGFCKEKAQRIITAEISEIQSTAGEYTLQLLFAVVTLLSVVTLGYYPHLSHRSATNHWK